MDKSKLNQLKQLAAVGEGPMAKAVAALGKKVTGDAVKAALEGAGYAVAVEIKMKSAKCDITHPTDGLVGRANVQEADDDVGDDAVLMATLGALREGR